MQDFEALTPNLLARTVETVDGGGIVVLLLRTMSSLKQLYTMTMVCRSVCDDNGMYVDLYMITVVCRLVHDDNGTYVNLYTLIRSCTYVDLYAVTMLQYIHVYLFEYNEEDFKTLHRVTVPALVCPFLESPHIELLTSCLVCPMSTSTCTPYLCVVCYMYWPHYFAGCPC